jgi:hypothetical protein
MLDLTPAMLRKDIIHEVKKLSAASPWIMAYLYLQVAASSKAANNVLLPCLL